MNAAAVPGRQPPAAPGQHARPRTPATLPQARPARHASAGAHPRPRGCRKRRRGRAARPRSWRRYCLPGPAAPPPRRRGRSRAGWTRWLACWRRRWSLRRGPGAGAAARRDVSAAAAAWWVTWRRLPHSAAAQQAPPIKQGGREGDRPQQRAARTNGVDLHSFQAHLALRSGAGVNEHVAPRGAAHGHGQLLPGAHVDPRLRWMMHGAGAGQGPRGQGVTQLAGAPARAGGGAAGAQRPAGAAAPAGSPPPGRCPARSRRRCQCRLTRCAAAAAPP